MKKNFKPLSKLCREIQGQTSPQHSRSLDPFSTLFNDDIISRLKRDVSIQTEDDPSIRVESIAFDSTGRFLASGNRFLRIWDLESHYRDQIIYSYTSDYPIYAIAFLEDGFGNVTHVVSGTLQGKITVHKFCVGLTPIKTFRCHHSCIRNICAIKYPHEGAGFMFLTSASDGSVRIFDLRENHSCGPIDTPCENVLNNLCNEDSFITFSLFNSTVDILAMAVNPKDSNYYVVCGGDNSIRLFDLKQLKLTAPGKYMPIKEIHRWVPLKNVDNQRIIINSVAWSNNGSRLAVCFSNSKILILDASLDKIKQIFNERFQKQWKEQQKMIKKKKTGSKKRKRSKEREEEVDEDQQLGNSNGGMDDDDNSNDHHHDDDKNSKSRRAPQPKRRKTAETTNLANLIMTSSSSSSSNTTEQEESSDSRMQVDSNTTSNHRPSTPNQSNTSSSSSSSFGSRLSSLNPFSRAFWSSFRSRSSSSVDQQSQNTSNSQTSISSLDQNNSSNSSSMRSTLSTQTEMQTSSRDQDIVTDSSSSTTSQNQQQNPLFPLPFDLDSILSDPNAETTSSWIRGPNGEPIGRIRRITIRNTIPARLHPNQINPHINQSQSSTESVQNQTQSSTNQTQNQTQNQTENQTNPSQTPLSFLPGLLRDLQGTAARPGSQVAQFSVSVGRPSSTPSRAYISMVRSNNGNTTRPIVATGSESLSQTIANALAASISAQLGIPWSPAGNSQNPFSQSPSALPYTVDESFLFELTGFKSSRISVVRVAFFGEDYVTSGSENGGIYVWNIRTGKLVHVLAGHPEFAQQALWRPGSLSLVSHGSGSALHLYNPISADLHHPEDPSALEQNENTFLGNFDPNLSSREAMQGFIDALQVRNWFPDPPRTTPETQPPAAPSDTAPSAASSQSSSGSSTLPNRRRPAEREESSDEGETLGQGGICPMQ